MEEQTIEQIVEGNFGSRRKQTKFISNLRKNRLKSQKDFFKGEIRSTKDKIKKQELKKRYQEIFKEGVSKNSNNNIIELRNVHKLYTSKENYEYVLKNINLEIKRGEITVILGASGSGKTTLLNIISGLMDASLGNVIVNNTDLYYLNESRKTKFRAKYISFVFQSYNLIPTLTVLENIKVGYNLRPSNDEFISIDEILKILGLEEKRRSYPYQLSGGQNQRISIGRALAKSPEILFADEPTGALDEKKGKEVLQLLIDINKKFKTTLVIVTHNPNFKLIADKIIKIASGEIESIEQNEKINDVGEIKWT